jgi:acetate kinase
MRILVFNCGSSSLKYRLIDLPGEKELVGGEAQRVGPKTAEPARIIHRIGKGEETHYVEMPDHASALGEVMKLLKRDPNLVPDALGHRVVHGGAGFHRHTRIDDGVIEALEPTLALAPIHNPPIVKLIRACRQLYPELPQVAVFDTAFHATIPIHARTYALPRRLREDEGIRKYGFHGISHQYVTTEAARLLNIPLEKFNAVSCHLGSGGASLCAVVNGRSIDNTMGYSPLQGLVMSTRSGDLDPAITLQLLALDYGDCRAIEKTLNSKSGVLGMSGISADIRDVLRKAAESGSETDTADVTAQVYLWRIRKYLGAYLTIVGNADAIIFTDTIGELVPAVRQAVCSEMECFGVLIDQQKNISATTLPADVAADDSKVRILAIATNEELAIARFSYNVLMADGHPKNAGGAA